jgi:hypothetical protein
LVQAIPPPVELRYTTGTPPASTLTAQPDDHRAFVAAYGSGEFVYGDRGCVIEVFNPGDPWHRASVAHSHDSLRDYRASEGDEYLPYPVHPESPGVMICGWNDSRDYYFWHTVRDDPNRWPTIFYGDLQDVREYQVPLVVFIQKLLFGEISRRDLGFAEPDYEPSGFEFRPSWRTGEPPAGG